jgi:hypothetical protein
MRDCAIIGYTEGNVIIDRIEAGAEDGTLLTSYEMLDGIELATRLKVRPTWVRKQVAAADPIPNIKLGRYVRFLWGSPDLDRWLSRRYRT